MTNRYGEFVTYAEARMALEEAVQDVEADNPGGSHEGYGDIVRVVAENCTPEVRAELFRRTGVHDYEGSR